MKEKMKILILMLVSFFLFPDHLCKASFLEMNFKQASIYTPGNINLTMKLTSAAKIENNYKFKVSILLAGTLIREQTIKADREKPVNFELAVPEVFDKTEGRCRCELFLENNFLEAQELPLLLWPAIAPYKKETQANTEIWVYDTSGKLLDIFRKMEIKVVDATFKTARDFGKPDIVFVGENTDPNNMQILANSISTVRSQPVVIYLRQKQFLREAKIAVPTENNKPQNVKCDMESPLLGGLSLSDILSLVDNAGYIKIKKEVKGDRSIQSFVTEEKEDTSNIYSYLCIAKKDNQPAIYCQLPVITGSDPRYVILLKNMLQYAESQNSAIKAK
jgi:hypothetical protein